MSARRRSARLAHTVTPQGKLAAPTQLAAPEIASPIRKTVDGNSHAAAASPLRVPATPASAALRPPSTEMHPSKFQQTSFAPSSALDLGFSDIKDPRRRDSTHGSGLDSTPSRMGGVSASAFSFRVRVPGWSSEKTSKVQDFMAGLKGEVEKIKAELSAQREASQPSAPGAGERAFAKPKGKTGRFSAAHMAEFKKMGSIEGHASAWRAQTGRLTPAKPSNIDVSPTPHKSNSKRIPTKPPAPEAAAAGATSDRLHLGLKRKQSAAQLGAGQTGATRIGGEAAARFGGAAVRPPAKEVASASAKRLKQNAGDDASTARPESHESESTPKPQPTARKIRSIARPGFSRPRDAIRPPVGLTKPAASRTDTTSSTPRQPQAEPDRLLSDDATITNATENMTLGPSTPGSPERKSSPSRFQKARSILRGQLSGFDGGGQRSGIPQLAAPRDQALASLRAEKSLPPPPPPPLVTPHRRAAKKVTFTPDTARVAMDQDSPSPYRFGFVGKAKAMLGLESKQSASGDVAYPDLTSHLSGLAGVAEPDPNDMAVDAASASASVKTSGPSGPGTFSFRSDKTIEFGAASPTTGFGALPGQSSVRAVRESMMRPVSPCSPSAATEMPGGFPLATSPASHSNKENAVPSPPQVLIGALHGMSNKKRRRTSADSDMADVGDDRSTKKKRAEVEAPAPARALGTTPVKKTQAGGLLPPIGRTPAKAAPGRFLGRAQGRTPGAPTAPTPAPAKKRTTFDMSRINQLAMPKTRREVTK